LNGLNDWNPRVVAAELRDLAVWLGSGDRYHQLEFPMQRAFFPGSVDYEGQMSRGFRSGRALSSHSLAVWRAALEPYIGQANNLLDLGSGTGRFSVLIAQWFDITVIGVEPAGGMRKVAATDGRHANVFYVAGRAEQLPLREISLMAALLSNVYHHVADRRACAAELHRVLRPGSRVLIRGVFAGRVGEITMFDHFPEAKAVCEQFPTMEETVQTFTESGFEFETIERVVQQTCLSLKELAERTRLRADTTIALMRDEQFSARQAALEAAAAREKEPTPVVETLDLLVLRRLAE
jgi:ubiquinone/menaquinone biosynthesis C-methylase UbiE